MWRESRRGSFRSKRGGRFVSSRGRGRANVSNKWVRTTQQQDASTASTEAPSDQPSKVGEEGPSTVASDSRETSERSTATATTASTGVILKGPKRFPPPAKRHVWKRSNKESTAAGSSSTTETTEEESKTESAAAASLQVTGDGKSIGGTAGQPEHNGEADKVIGASTAQLTSMARRGRHKLVSKKPKGDAEDDDGKPKAQRAEPNGDTKSHRKDVAESKDEATGQSSADNVESALVATSVQISSMARRGRHKLVSNKPAEQLVEEDEKPRARVGEPNGTVGEEGAESAASALVRRGRNKLVLANDGTKPTGEGDQIDESQQQRMGDTGKPVALTGVTGQDELQGEQLHQPGSVGGVTESSDDSRVHKKRGRHKLVLTDAHSQTKGKSENRSMGHIQSSRGRRRGRVERGAKRIKLNAEETLGAGETAADEDGGESSRAAAGDKYTEFAYRQSSTVSQRGRGRGFRGRGGGAKPRSNMGLVRVEPDAATTPICTTYLRGVPCTNPKCRKRHDVPKEAATPICSFFQRHGQCNKGDACPFRHIKVNPHATVCPSFSLLGFCENKDCVMRHVRAPKSKQGTGNNS